MKISYTIETCRDQLSPECTKTFNREIKRGRPQVNCNACKAYKVPVAPRGKQNIEGKPEQVERDCPCGKKFMVTTIGRGRRPSKCEACRDAGTVYRANDDGVIEAIRAETLSEEQRELREQAGRDRAAALVALMKPLIDRDEKRRKSLVKV